MNREFSATQSLLLSCLRRALDHDVPLTLSADIDWAAFLRLAREQGVLQWFDHGNSIPLPEVVIAEARRERLEITQRNMLLARELLRLLEAFERDDIEALPFKGVVNAIELVGNMSLRPSGDIDLLVRVRDRARAVQVLKRAAYRLDAEHPEAFQSAWYELRSGTTVDLHWKIPPRRPPLDHRALRRHRVNIALLGTTVSTFDRDSAIAIAAINCVKGYWNVSLKQLMDVVVPLRGLTPAGWHRALMRCRRIGCARFLLAAVCLGDSLLPNAMPSHVTATAVGDATARSIANEVIEHLFTRSLSAGATVRFASREAYEAALDDRPFASQRETLQRWLEPNAKDLSFIRLPDGLAWLYYPIKPIRVIWQRGKRALASRLGPTSLDP